MTSKRLMTLAAASAAALWVGQAQAATFDLELSGVVANGSFSSQEIGPTHFDQWFLSLSGLDAGNAITVSQGDTINATVTLDQPFTIPASAQITSFTLFLFGSAFPSIDTGTSGTTDFFLGGVQGPHGAASTGTCCQLANSVDFFPPDNGAITFDKVVSSFTIDSLGQPVTLDGSAISYTLFSPIAGVPEPAGWALMLLGFGGLGATLRSKRRLAAA